MLDSDISELYISDNSGFVAFFFHRVSTSAVRLAPIKKEIKLIIVQQTYFIVLRSIFHKFVCLCMFVCVCKGGGGEGGRQFDSTMYHLQVCLNNYYSCLAKIINICV